MTFEDETEDGGKVWGIPYFSTVGAGWLVAWFSESCTLEGATVPTAKELAWILANQDEIERQRATFSAYCKANGIRTLIK